MPKVHYAFPIKLEAVTMQEEGQLTLEPLMQLAGSISPLGYFSVEAEEGKPTLYQLQLDGGQLKLRNVSPK